MNGCTDLGNAARFARDHRLCLRYAHGLGWFCWDGARWKPAENGEVERYARDTVRGIYREAQEEADPGRRQELGRWAVQSESRPRIDNILALAQSELELVATARSFDQDKLLLNTASGTVDLRTGELRPHAPADLITKLAPRFYREGAACPGWNRFLDRIFGGNLELIQFVQRAVGYSLTGDTSEQAFFLLYGTGANGKTVFLEVLRSIMGDYAANADASTFMARRDSGPRPDLARLRGARFVTAAETDDGKRLAEAMVKSLTGGDAVTCRFLYGRDFEYRPTLKVWLSTNHRPTIRGTDYAIWRRIRLIPFNVTIPPAEQDRHLAERLVADEGPGILSWAVDGCLAWQQDGLGESEAVTAATAEYREEQDILAAFLGDECVVAESLTARDLYSSYVTWARAAGEETMTAQAFGCRMKERGFQNGRDARGRFFRGVGLRAKDQQEERYPRPVAKA